MALLEIENLYVRFDTKDGPIDAVNGVDLSIEENTIIAMVGESGSGKSVTALSSVGLLPFPGKILSGSVILEGVNILELGSEDLRKVRGPKIGMVFQDPRASLNPIIPIGTQVKEVLLAHTNMTDGEAVEYSLKLMADMGLPNPGKLLSQFPFQLSGGMCQRVMLSIALALKPRLLIADEPTSNLDSTLQAGILHELKMLKENHGTAILLITHDMGVVAQMADSVAVMYGGTIVEQSDIFGLFKRPSHPYTEGLFNALPRLDDPEKKLTTMKGIPPESRTSHDECPFISRCYKVTNECRTRPKPALRQIGVNHKVACFNEIQYD